MASDTPLVGVIGGSGLYKLEGVQQIKVIDDIVTPWGKPSSPVTISRLPTGEPIAFIARHGLHHQINPSEVPSRANIAAFKHLGIKAIVAFSAVGSLQEHIKPRDVVIPSSIIDRTKGIRPATYFENGITGYAMFGDAFSVSLSALVSKLVADVLKTVPSSPDLHTDKTVVCMEGPAFSTRAESHMYRAWGGDIINMSVLPEAKLAREAELSYALICTSTDYDCWRVSEKPVTADEVMAVLHDNAAVSNQITTSVLAHVHKELQKGGEGAVQSEDGAMQFGIITKPEAISKEVKERLAYILPKYFS